MKHARNTSYDEQRRRARAIRAAKAWANGILLISAGSGLLWLMWDRAIQAFMVALWIFAGLGYCRVVCVIVTWIIQLTVDRADGGKEMY